jgi:hypothetical protein
MTTMIHGRRHEVEFYSAPDGNQWLAAMQEVLGVGHCYKVVDRSDDRTKFVIEEVDIWRTLDRQPTLSTYTKVVPIVLTCDTCRMIYNVYRIVGDDWTQDKYWLYTPHCPACPPMSPEVWLTGLGYYPERPSIAPPIEQVKINSAINMADFD